MEKPIVSGESLLEELREQPNRGIAVYNRVLPFLLHWDPWSVIYWILKNLTLGHVLKSYLEATTE